MNKREISTCVVLYKHPEKMLENFLFSYEKSVKHLQEKFDNHIIFILYIINNDIEDLINYDIPSLQEKYKVKLEYILSEKNGGYGYGNNLVLNQLQSYYHLVVNPDVTFFDDTFLEAIRYMDLHPEVGLLTPSIRLPNGERQFSCRRNPSLLSQTLRFVFKKKKKIFKKYLTHYEYQDYSYDKIIYDVPNCSGSFMFFRTTIFKKLKGFDERFFYYMEDADLSRRALDIAHTVYLPSVRIVHEYQSEAYKNKKLRNEAIKSAFKYFIKWRSL